MASVDVYARLDEAGRKRLLELELALVTGEKTLEEIAVEGGYTLEMLRGYVKAFGLDATGLYSLSINRQRFVEEYCTDLDHVKASRRLGLSDGYGREALKIPAVQQAVQVRLRQKMARFRVNQDAVLEELARVAFLDIRKLYDEAGNLRPLNALDDDTAAAIAGVEVVEAAGNELIKTKKIKLHDKLAALNTLQKHFTPDRLEVTGKDGAPLVAPEVSANELARRVAFLLAKAPSAPGAPQMMPQIMPPITPSTN